MWDLKLNNTCNHRIINEKLDIKYSDPNYYAILKRPVYGDNLQVKIVNEDDLFSENPTFLEYELGENRKTLIFKNKDQIDIREGIYPINNYYATYYTNQQNCPKCIYGTNRTNDFYIDVIGKPKISQGFELLIQQVKKVLITQIQSNLFDINYGTDLPDLIGKPKKVLTLLRAQNTIQDAINYIQNKQFNNYNILSDDQKLLKMDNFQVMETENPKVLKFSFEIYNVSGQNVNIGVSI